MQHYAFIWYAKFDVQGVQLLIVKKRSKSRALELLQWATVTLTKPKFQ